MAVNSKATKVVCYVLDATVNKSQNNLAIDGIAAN